MDSIFQRAWAAQAGGKLAEAMALYREILGKNNSASAWIGLGQCHLERKENKEALAAFRKAHELLPQSGAIRHMVDMLAGGQPTRAPDDYVIWVFDGHAENFDNHLKSLNYCGPQMVAGLIESAWSKDSSREILDLGCGTGLNAPLFRPYAKQLHGVDLAPRMLQQAARRGGYDHLYEAEIHAFLGQPPIMYDAILATDVFIYIGELEDIFSLSYQSLNKNGELLFTIELNSGPSPVELRQTGRFRQTDAYVRDVAVRAGFRMVGFVDGPLRVENSQSEAGRAYRLVRS